jgi:hypothetical protein
VKLIPLDDLDAIEVAFAEGLYQDGEAGPIGTACAYLQRLLAEVRRNRASRSARNSKYHLKNVDASRQRAREAYQRRVARGGLSTEEVRARKNEKDRRYREQLKIVGQTPEQKARRNERRRALRAKKKAE